MHVIFEKEEREGGRGNDIFKMAAEHAYDSSKCIQITVSTIPAEGRDLGTVAHAAQHDDPQTHRGQGSSVESGTSRGKVNQTETKEPFFFVRWMTHHPRLSFGKCL